jgi:beta-galactosidase
VSAKVIPDKRLIKIPSLARVGMSLTLDPTLCSVQYFGRGPHENYPDRKAASEMGVWKTTAKDNPFSYIFPSENGNKTNCHWLTLLDAKGRGLCIVTDHKGDDICQDRGFNFSVGLHSQQELHAARHTYDLPPRKNGVAPVYINIDHKIMGLGGDVRCVIYFLLCERLVFDCVLCQVSQLSCFSLA